ncbi:MAG: ribbon-helix-helix protein, CopG family [Peptococcaceae bacterium]|nr:ribbon-helix-helix protein, CopG family [Peptococcaceae bacterium]
MTPRMGRPPSENPKSESCHIRLDAEHLEILNNYCEQEGVTRTEAIRRGIKKLEPDIKK